LIQETLKGGFDAKVPKHILVRAHFAVAISRITGLPRVLRLARQLDAERIAPVSAAGSAVRYRLIAALVADGMPRARLFSWTPNASGVSEWSGGVSDGKFGMMSFDVMLLQG